MSMLPTTDRNRRQEAIGRNRARFLPDDMMANILSVYAIASEEERRAGESWYSLAHVEAERATDGHPSASAIVAALSPQNPWGQNIVDAASLTAGGPTTQPEDSERKAQAILDGADPDATLGGRKVRSFWRNIEEPLRSGPVTIDRHATAAALLGAGSYTEATRKAVTGRIVERVGVYQLVAGAYRAAARALGLRPHELQAIVWLAWRRSQDIGWSSNDPF